MRRVLTLFVRMVLTAAVVAVVRNRFVERLPSHRSLDGTEPLVGSIDTWPKVPRRPKD